MNITIPVDQKLEACTGYVTVINYFLTDKLTKGEIEALALIMEKDDPSREERERGRLLLDQKLVKEDILFTMDISAARFGNIISRLKKKNAIIKDGRGGYKLHPVYDQAVTTGEFNLNVEWEKSPIESSHPE